ncbi:MAG TPA: biotin--[acetyl-CoA-carboxylase] ligase [Acidimicrobiia bacterium]|nr:biotin--[acetyl-CoA-carboxylase] ligase [Acidimicrobiia bacterium]
MGDAAASPGAGWRLCRFDEIDSTNRYALDAGRAGEPAGLVVVADHQAAGRGRRGRAWSAPPGSSLLVSVLLRPQLAPDAVHVVTMAAALALADAVRSVAGIDADLKWPNDLLVGDRKLAGLLAEADVIGGVVQAVVIGVGCNVRWAGFPAELDDTATACDREAGHPIERAELLEALLAELAARLGHLDTVPADYRARLATIGRPVRVELTDDTITGLATGVDDRGCLIVQPSTGPPVTVAAGDVVHLRRVTDPGSTRSG